MTACAELRSLTGVRGVAAWAVVLYHIRGALPGAPPVALRLLGKGYLAVDVFFVLSGFVIWLSWSARLRTGERGAVIRFAVKRVARIWPLHAVMLGVAVLLAAALTVAGHPDPVAFPWADLPWHALLLQQWGVVDRLAWNDPAWSISAELAAYALMPLLAMAFAGRRMPRPVLLALPAVLAMLLWAAMGFGDDLGMAIPRYGILRCLAEFASGAAMCALWRGGDVPQWGAAIVGIGAGVALVLGAPEPLAIPLLWSATILWLASSDTDRPSFLARPVWHRLGLVSYATYLSHFLLWKIVKLLAVDATGIASPPVVLVYLVIVLAASFALYHGVERPAQRWIERSPARRPAPMTRQAGSSSSSS